MDAQDVSSQKIQIKDPKVQSLQDASSKINQNFKERSIADTAKQSDGKYGYIDIARTPINPDLFALVDADLAEQALLIPFFRLGMKLRVAVADPENQMAKQLLQDFANKKYEVQLNLASAEGIKLALKQFHQAQALETQKLETKVDETQLEEYQKELENLAKLTEKIQASSAKEGLNALEIGAIKTGASDIHFQPEKDGVRVRFRIDGILQELTKLDLTVYAQLAQQIKYEAKMKLNVHDVPQDGRIAFRINDRDIDVRVSALPTAYGETLVLRILDSGKQFGNFAKLGFTNEQLAQIDAISNLSQGMILITGPTGSGKTTTLYSLLSRYNTPEKKIITLEDPIEYRLERVVQSQIREDKGYSFSAGLESVLRQDPDVVMIGEIRDLDTAQTATQAALTGHVMLSTLHTNSALESIPRLTNMGLEPFVIAPALDTIMAQRLVRTFCPHCKTEEIVSASDKAYLEKELAAINELKGTNYVVPETLPKANGCKACNQTGYLGRLVIVEIIRLDDEFREVVLENSSSLLALKEAAVKRGILFMKQDGVLKVISGQTSLSEVRRVTN